MSGLTTAIQIIHNVTRTINETIYDMQQEKIALRTDLNQYIPTNTTPHDEPKIGERVINNRTRKKEDEDSLDEVIDKFLEELELAETAEERKRIEEQDELVFLRKLSTETKKELDLVGKKLAEKEKEITQLKSALDIKNTPSCQQHFPEESLSREIATLKESLETKEAEFKRKIERLQTTIGQITQEKETSEQIFLKKEADYESRIKHLTQENNSLKKERNELLQEQETFQTILQEKQIYTLSSFGQYDSLPSDHSSEELESSDADSVGESQLQEQLYDKQEEINRLQLTLAQIKTSLDEYNQSPTEPGALIKYLSKSLSKLNL